MKINNNEKTQKIIMIKINYIIKIIIRLKLLND